jgi:D-sedoheptulose 7-phosphate isomerase
MFTAVLKEHIGCMAQLEALASPVEAIGDLLARSIRDGNRMLICGNGGSAADAQHFAAELIGRFERERSAWPAIALTTDTSILTAIGNDYGFNEIFARQVEGLGRQGDVLVGISTSGHSENVLRAAAAARQQKMHTIGLLGRDGGKLKTAMDHSVVIQDAKTARIQEAHIFILHYWAHVIEHQLAKTTITIG